jgi:hypothetical protein
MEGCGTAYRTVPYHTVLCYQHTVRGSKKDAKKYITLDVDETQTKQPEYSDRRTVYVLEHSVLCVSLRELS